MRDVRPRIRTLLFGCAIAGSLAFGASQAVATPPETGIPKACDPRCAPDCDGFGGELRHWGCLCCG